MVRILIADDHEVVRQGIRALIQEQRDWSVCAEAVTGRDAVTKAIEHHPDIVVLDVSMPEMNGLEATVEIRREVPSAKILVLTVHEAGEFAHEFSDAGALGIIGKADTGRTLVEAINTLLRGGTFFGGRLRETSSSVASPGEAAPRLSKRERQVLQLLAEGKSNKEIGTMLDISTKTAETHRARLMAKLNVHTIAELVRYAIRHRIVDA